VTGQESVPWLEERWVEPSDSLFHHYTTLDGLLGIIGTGELWASHVGYLNDTSEFKTGVNTVTEIMMEKMNLEEQNFNTMDIYNALITQLMLPIYVTSFSAEPTGDDLSQWRAYGGVHTGFSLGFSREYLIAIGMDFLSSGVGHGWIQKPISPFIQCEYFDEKDQGNFRALVGRQIDKASNDRLERLSSTAPFLLARYAAGLKHRSFVAEREWRIVLMRENHDVFEGLEFRRSNSLVVPYVRIPLRLAGQAIKISRVVIGPTPHRKEVRESIEMLLKKHKVEYSEIVESSIPFRNW
jgi:Protein of unknown function (DUF2971)